MWQSSLRGFQNPCGNLPRKSTRNSLILTVLYKGLGQSQCTILLHSSVTKTGTVVAEFYGGICIQIEVILI